MNYNIDRMLLRVAIVLGIALFVFQCLLQMQGLRSLITSVDQLEGVPYVREQNRVRDFVK
ncbi:hypothetical protein NV379_06555 [Paenibacillus sp. N1-5-1-14]|nr:hypothetical protein [Paenibacillus radicibacter]